MKQKEQKISFGTPNVSRSPSFNIETSFKAESNNKYRYVFVILGTLVYGITPWLRVSTSVIRNNLMTKFDITESQASLIDSFYFVGYLIVQIISGISLETYSAEFILTISTFLTGVSTLWFGLSNCFEIALLSRFAMGVASGPVWLACLTIVGTHFDSHKVSTFVSIVNAFSFFGCTILVLQSVMPAWNTIFFIIAGYLSICAPIMCYFWYADRKDQTNKLNYSAIAGSHKKSVAEIILDTSQTPTPAQTQTQTETGELTQIKETRVKAESIPNCCFSCNQLKSFLCKHTNFMRLNGFFMNRVSMLKHLRNKTPHGSMGTIVENDNYMKESTFWKKMILVINNPHNTLLIFYIGITLATKYALGIQIFGYLGTKFGFSKELGSTAQALQYVGAGNKNTLCLYML